jgi:hypothetical protein
MNPNIPEEIQAMAALIGQSSAIDAMMVDKPKELVTDTNTLKQGLNQYIQQQRSQIAAPPAPPAPPATHYHEPSISVPVPPPAQYYEPYPVNTPVPQSNELQLELNLEPKQLDQVINILKEISVKLTKQNNLLQKIHDTQYQKERISDAPIKLGKH